MSSRSYRVYIRFGKFNCVRFFAQGDGTITQDGLELFEWIKNPNNIMRLRSGLQHVHEIGRNEIRDLLASKLWEDGFTLREQVHNHQGDSDLIDGLEQQCDWFNSLPKGVDKLEAISNAKDKMAIPRARPRKRSDPPGWIYLLNLEYDTLEAYEFKNHRPSQNSPFERLTVSSIFEEFPDAPPGYYKKMTLSELQVMWQKDWINEHEFHAEVLNMLWKNNAELLKTVPHADTVPFAVLYGSVFDGREGNDVNKRYSRRLTEERLTRALAALNRRNPAQVSTVRYKSTRSPKEQRRLRIEHNIQRAHAFEVQQRRAKRMKTGRSTKGKCSSMGA